MYLIEWMKCELVERKGEKLIEESSYMNKVGSKSKHNLRKVQRFLWNERLGWIPKFSEYANALSFL